MGDVSKAISIYIDDEIRLNITAISQSVKSREWFLKRIANVIESRQREPVLYAPENFIYFGSYFKGTKVKSVDEFDVLVIIDSNTGIYSRDGSEIGEGQGAANPNHKYDRKYFKSDDSGISPAKMLNWLKGIVTEITDAYGGEAPERNGQAITATIQSQNLRIDLVPGGVFKRNSDGTVFYNIPKGDKNNGWILTSPRADIDLLNSAAQNKDDFKNVIRIAKRIKDTYNFNVPSFAIETAIISYGSTNRWHNNLYHDVTGAIKYLAGSFSVGNIPDPYDANNNLLSGIDSLSWYADRLDKIKAELEKCINIDDQEKVNDRVRKAFENKL